MSKGASCQSDTKFVLGFLDSFCRRQLFVTTSVYQLSMIKQITYVNSALQGIFTVGLAKFTKSDDRYSKLKMTFRMGQLPGNECFKQMETSTD